eukprot:m.44717 g.44717  ORF g.44717 m.44717 type:complete len:116 (+) comp13043_c0_seq1:65-412(+)
MAVLSKIQLFLYPVFGFSLKLVDSNAMYLGLRRDVVLHGLFAERKIERYAIKNRSLSLANVRWVKDITMHVALSCIQPMVVESGKETVHVKPNCTSTWIVYHSVWCVQASQGNPL